MIIKTDYRLTRKEVYSNICMKIHLSLKLTQYLINIFKMRFLMRNFLKYAHQCQNGIFKKTCRTTTVPYSVMWISPQYLYTLEVGLWEIPLHLHAGKHALRPF